MGAAGTAGTRSALVLPEKVAQLLAQREAETLSPVAGQAGFHSQSEAGGHSSFALVRWWVDCQSARLLCLQGAATGCSRDHVATKPPRQEVGSSGLRREGFLAACGPSKAPTEAVAGPVLRLRALQMGGPVTPGLGEVSGCTVAGSPAGARGRGGRSLLRYLQAADCVPQEGLPPGSVESLDHQLPLRTLWVGPEFSPSRRLWLPLGRPELRRRVRWASWASNRVPHRVGSSCSSSSLPRPACSPWLSPESACGVCLLLLPLHVVSSCAPCGAPGCPPSHNCCSGHGDAWVAEAGTSGFAFHLQQDSSGGDWHS